MTGRILKWFGVGLLGLLLLVAIVLYWLAATESGTRWLVARAEPFLPAALSIGDVEGTVLQGLDLRSVHWNDESVDASLARLSVRAELRPLLKRELRIIDLAVRNVDIEIHERTASNDDDRPFSLELPVTLDIHSASVETLQIARGDSEFLIDRIDIAGRLAHSTLELRQLLVRSNITDVDLQAEARLKDDFQARLTGSWQLRLSGQPPLSGELSVHGDTSGYELSHDLAAPSAVATTGSLRFVDGQPVVELDNTWQQLRLSRADGDAVNIDDGRLFVSGSIDDFAFDAAARVIAGDIAPVSVTTRGRRTRDVVAVETLTLATDVGQLQASGSATIAPELEIAIERITGVLNGHPVDGSALLAYSDNQLTLRESTVSIGDNKVEGSGTFGEEMRAEARIHLLDLTQLGIDASGALQGEVDLQSTPGGVTLAGNLRGESISWQTYGAASMSAQFDLSTAGSGSAEIRVGDGRIGGMEIASGTLTVDGDAAAHKVQLEVSADETHAQLRLAGGLLEETWSGSIESLNISGERPGEWRLQKASALMASSAGVSLGNTCLDRVSAAGRACFGVDYETSGLIQFDLEVAEYPVAALPVYLPEGASIRGTLHASANGRIVDRSISADATLAAEDLELNALFEGDEVSAAFDLAEAAATITDNRLAGDLHIRLEESSDHLRGDVEIADVFDVASQLNGSASLEVTDLGLLAFFFPDITKPEGRVSGNVEIAGSMEAPGIIGEISLEDGSFDVRRAGISIEDMAISLRQDKPGFLALKGSAKSGDGSIDISGTTSMSANSGIRTELTLQGEAFTLVRLPDWYVTASPDISVVVDDRKLHVDGELGIPAATINIRGLPEGADRPSPDVVVHRDVEQVETTRRQYFVDVRTVLGEKVSFSGFGLTTDLGGGVRITASSAAPMSGAGRVVLNKGQYKAYGQVLDIESGELVFNGPLENPALNVRANRKASDGTVAGIHLTGTAQQLRSEVYSEPPLSDAEALSYLLTGRPLSSADSAQGDMLNQAAFALGLTTAGSIASTIRDQLGLDTLGIQGGAENRQFVAGKRINDRLLVEYAYGIIDNLGTLLLRYQLTSRLVVESRSGSVRNVDLVYSVKKP